ncbi:hypothetical protein FQN52_000262 [Onygenales sp. PD_12]|nr:hypothetical protein FQN52_000262 [Onygenales sp. PD_12]
MRPTLTALLLPLLALTSLTLTLAQDDPCSKNDAQRCRIRDDNTGVVDLCAKTYWKVWLDCGASCCKQEGERAFCVPEGC